MITSPQVSVPLISRLVVCYGRGGTTPFRSPVSFVFNALFSWRNSFFLLAVLLSRGGLHFIAFVTWSYVHVSITYACVFWYKIFATVVVISQLSHGISAGGEGMNDNLKHSRDLRNVHATFGTLDHMTQALNACLNLFEFP